MSIDVLGCAPRFPAMERSECMRKRTITTIVLVAIGISVITILGMLAQGLNNQWPGTSSNPSPRPTSAVARPGIDRSPAMQQKRSKFIAELIADGVFTKVKTNIANYPEVYVTSRF